MNTNYRVEYLNPKAIRRYTQRGGTNVEQFIRDNSTLSFVKHLPAFKTAAEAQVVADKLNAEGTGQFAGMVFFRVIEREAPVLQAAHTTVDVARLERELQQDYDIELQTMGRRFADESDAFARRVLGMDDEDSECQ